MEDPISRVRSLAAAHNAQGAELRSALLQFAERIVQAASGADVHVSSSNIVFEQAGDEAVYGHLFYDRGQVSVAYRSTEEDYMDYIHQESIDESFSVKPLMDCSARWLRAISERAVIDSFMASLRSSLEEQHTQLADNIRHLGQTLNIPIRNAEAALETAARQLGYDDIIAEWQRAQGAVYGDPRDAITRSSSLIETVCKHILKTKGKALPSDQSIQGLLKATFSVLGLAPETQLTAGLRKLSGGIITVVHSLGVLRTHEGTAHGHEPGDRAPTNVEARLAVNVAGVASTFLMEAAYRSDQQAAR